LIREKESLHAGAPRSVLFPQEKEKRREERFSFENIEGKRGASMASRIQIIKGRRRGEGKGGRSRFQGPEGGPKSPLLPLSFTEWC